MKSTVKKLVKKAQNGLSAKSDNTLVRKPAIKPSKEMSDAKEKVKIAKQLYKDNPSKVFRDAVDSAEARLSRVPKQKSGGKTMLKRADGSVSQRGLWDNLRNKAAQNKKTGAKPKAPTKAMLTQERKIKAKGK